VPGKCTHVKPMSSAMTICLLFSVKTIRLDSPDVASAPQN
jgi:hypothetical protein